MKTYGYLLSIVLTILMCSSWSSIQAQQNRQQIKKSNLFTYGSPVTDEKTNFDNFVTNFNSCIQNANKIDPSDIVYIGKVKNSVHARELISHNIHHGAPARGIISRYGGSDEKEKAFSYFMLNKDARIDTTQTSISGIVDTLANYYIHAGDVVYAIKLVSSNHQTFDYYVFVNSKTKQVVTKGNMLAFEIPVDFIEKKNKDSY